MLLNRVETKLNELIDEPVTLNTYEMRSKADSHDAHVLVDATDIPSLKCTEHEVIFRGEKSGTEYCKARYFEFTGNSAAHIDWVEVHEDARGNGIGRLVRRAIVDDLSHVDAVYSKIVNDKLISVAIDQGFRQIKYGDLEGWFVRE